MRHPPPFRVALRVPPAARLSARMEQPPSHHLQSPIPRPARFTWQGHPAPAMNRPLGAACIAAVAAAGAAPLLAGEAHAQQQGEGQVPAWVKQVFAYYVDGQITESELLNALKYLIENGIMQVSEPEDSGIADRGDFYVEYGPNPNSPYPEYTAAEWLQETRLLEDNAGWLNDNYRLPYDIEVGGAECGVENAFYSPGEKAITMCYELVDQILGIGYELYGDDADTAEDFAYNVLDGIMLHETGHALVDVYDLPVTGLEEDAVDQFAALIQSRTYGEYDPYYETGQIMMLDVAQWWDYASQDEPHYYWDVHSLSIQRFYNIACYVYGSDPVYNADLVGAWYLPEERAETCPDEYKQMSSSWDRLLDGYLVE